MFRTTIFYDNFTNSIWGPWKLYVLIGASLIISAILIFVFPELVAYLIAFFLLFNGILFCTIALRLRKLRSSYGHRVNAFWEG